MSNRYKGGIISATSPTTTGGYLGIATGTWTLQQQMQAQNANLWPVQPPPSDAYFDYVTLLLNGDGTNGAQNNTFVDSSSNAFTITRNGNTTQGLFSPYGSLWGNYFNGSTDYLNGPTNNSAFDFSTGDFTVECWVFATSSSDASIYTNFGPSGAGGLELVTSSGYLFVWNHTASSLSMTSNTLLPLNQWVHVAVTRSGNNFTIWQNGVSVATQTISVTLKTNASSPVCIGGIYSGGGVAIPSWKGYISNLRVTKGGCLYTTTFTPSTTPLTTTVASGTVSWLTCQSNRFADSSANAFAMTTGGSPSVQRFSPFNPTVPYDTATIGGSSYMNGVDTGGSYLQTPSNSSLSQFTGDFSIEGWAYTDGVNTYNDFIQGATTGSPWWYIEISKTGSVNVSLGGGLGSLNGSGAYAKQWNHIVLCRSGSTVALFINGVRASTVTTSSTIGDTRAITIGSNYEEFGGYISGVRIVNGSSAYNAASSTLTVPTSPVSAITNTQLLLNMTNAGIPDYAMMNDLETVGNAQVSTSVKKFGTGSIAFDGNGDKLVAKTPVYMGTGNFTIEFWYYPTSFNNYQDFLIDSVLTDGSQQPKSFKFGNNSSGVYLYYNDAVGSFQFTTSNPFTLNTWQHIAFVKQGTTIYFYLNGVSTGTPKTVNQSFNYSGLQISNDATASLNGYIDDFRLTSGVARYPNGTTFTPPTEALPTY